MELFIKMKYYITLLLSILSFYSMAGDLYYSKGFTSSQKSQVEKCYKLDTSFPQQIKENTTSGDLLITGMISQRNGFLFMARSNAYGKWLESAPLFCDPRSEAVKERDAEQTHQKNLAAARKKAKRDIEAEKSAVLAEKRAAEIKVIEEQAAAERRYIKDQKIKAQLNRKEEQKNNNRKLAEKYKNVAKTCVNNDGERVKSALFSALPSIHRPGAIHIEDRKISKLRFFESKGFMEVFYSFKLYTQSQFGKKLGSKSEPNSLKDTLDIDVKAYGRSTAVAKCNITS